MWLEALTGLTWLTREGQLEDFFLEAGRHMRIKGPARLYLGTQGHSAASLRWAYAPGTASHPAPATNLAARVGHEKGPTLSGLYD